MTRRAIGSALLALPIAAAVAGLALAQASSPWQSRLLANEATGGQIGMAMARSDFRVLALRCEADKQPSLLYQTREKWADPLGEFSANLLIKIDEDPPVSLPAKLGPYPTETQGGAVDAIGLLASGGDLQRHIVRLATAREQVMVAAEIQGRIFQQARFTTDGSGQALQAIWHHCGIAAN